MYEVQGTLTSPTPPPHPISSVATCNVVNDPRDLSSVAKDHVRSTRYVNIPHPPPHPISSVATCDVVNDPRDLSSVAMDHVRSTRYVNIPNPPPHPNIAIFKNVRFTRTVFGA